MDDEHREAGVYERKMREGAALGHPDAMHGLAVVLAGRGGDVEAESWWRRAAELGHRAAMVHLADVHERRGDDAEAESWWRTAAATGDRRAMHILGARLVERGERGEAESWWRRAADAGDARAMFSLGVVLDERGERDEAAHWWGRAEQGWGDGDLADRAPLPNLAGRFAGQGRTVEAESWWRKAAAGVGDHRAMHRLGVVLAERADHDEAGHWCRRAPLFGDGDARATLDETARREIDEVIAAWAGSDGGARS